MTACNWREDALSDGSAQRLHNLQVRLAAIGQERARILSDLSACRQRIGYVEGAQRVLREQAPGIHLEIYLADLDHHLRAEHRTIDTLQARLMRLALTKREVITEINRGVHKMERSDTSA